MEDTKNKKLSAKLLAIAVAAALALSAAPALANESGDTEIEVGTGGSGSGSGTGGDTSGQGSGSGTVDPGPDASGDRSIAKGDGIVGTDGTLLAKGAAAEGAVSIAIGGALNYNNVWTNGAQATGQYSIAVGAGSQATGIRALAVGTMSEASGGYASAFGYNAKAKGDNSSAFGYFSSAGENAVAVGSVARAYGDYSIAIGNDLQAHSQYAIALGNRAEVGSNAESGVAIGNSAKASEKDAIALGTSSLAWDEKSVAIGVSSRAQGENSVAIGADSSTSWENAVALGTGAKVSSINSAAIGANSVVAWNARDSVALGANSKIQTRVSNSLALGANSEVDEAASNSVALGANSRVGYDETNIVSVGNERDNLYRRITNMDAGIFEHDAVNVSQLTKLGNSVADSIGGKSSYNRQEGKVTTSITVGSQTYDNLEAAIQAAATTGPGGVSSSWLLKVDGEGTSDHTVVGGSSVTLKGDSNLTISADTTDAKNAVYTFSIAEDLTFGNVTASSFKIADNGTGIDMNNTKITNLADGTDTSDAVNRGQMDTLAKSIQEALGGNTSYENGEITFKVDGKSYTSVYDAIEGALTNGGSGGAGSGSSLNVEVNNEAHSGDTLALTNSDSVHITTTDEGSYTFNVNPDLKLAERLTVGGDSGVKVTGSSVSINNDSAYIQENAMKVGNMVYDGSTNTLSFGTTAEAGAHALSAGETGSERTGRIKGLADGGVYKGSGDAVTGNQLWDAYQRMGALEGDIYNRLGDMQESINIVGAHAAALSGLHPIDYNPYEPTTLSAAIGTYRDEYAVAVGVFHYVRENVLFNLGASLCSDGDLMGRAGISFTVGKDMKRKPMLARDMAGMQQQMIAMQAKVEDLESERKRDKEALARNAETLKKNEEIMKQNEKLIRELTKRLEAKK